MSRRVLFGALMVAALLLAGASGDAAVHKTYQSITVADTAIGFTASTLDPAGKPQMTNCLGRLETASIRYRMDGTAPTDSEGQILNANDYLEIEDHADALALRMIRTTGTSGVIRFRCWAR